DRFGRHATFEVAQDAPGLGLGVAAADGPGRPVDREPRVLIGQAAAVVDAGFPAGFKDPSVHRLISFAPAGAAWCAGPQRAGAGVLNRNKHPPARRPVERPEAFDLAPRDEAGVREHAIHALFRLPQTLAARQLHKSHGLVHRSLLRVVVFPTDSTIRW